MRRVDTNFTLVMNVMLWNLGECNLTLRGYKSTGDSLVHVYDKMPFVSFGKI
jgi:hypothetical protein